MAILLVRSMHVDGTHANKNESINDYEFDAQSYKAVYYQVVVSGVAERAVAADTNTKPAITVPTAQCEAGN